MLRSQMPAWQRVAAAYRLFGLTPLLDEEVTPAGFVYANRVVALASDNADAPGVALHDLAHYLTAPKRRRLLPNFGLGEHPAVAEPGHGAAIVGELAANHEEGAAAYLNVSLARVLFGEKEAQRAAEYLNVNDNGLICRVAAPRDSRRLSRRGNARMYRWMVRRGIPQWAANGILVLGADGPEGTGICIDEDSVRKILGPVL